MKGNTINSVFKTLLAPRKIEYLILNEHLCLLEMSSKAAHFAYLPDEVTLGKDVRLSFPEFIGAETVLSAILKGQETYWELRGLERSSAQSCSELTPETLYLDIYVAANDIDNDKIASLIVLLEDVTERMELEQRLTQTTNEVKLLLDALTSSKNYINQIIESMADALFVTNSKGMIKAVNQAAQNLFEYSKEELVGKSMALIGMNKKWIQEVLGSVETSRLVKGTLIQDAEILTRSKNGREIPVSVSCSRLDIGEENTSQIIYIIRDITERKIAEDTLRRLEKAIETMQLGATITDPEGKIIYTNPAEASMHGYHVEELLGKEARVFAPRELWKPGQSRILKEMQSWKRESLNIRRDETTFPVQLRSDVVKNASGQPIGIVTISEDITERKETEEQLQRAKEEAEMAAHAKSEFLATISHEIRTPMNGVIGMTELLLETPLTPEQREFVETIRISGDTLLTLINDVLDFSKIDSDKLELEAQPFELRTCVEEVFDLLASKALEKKLELLYFIDPRVPSFIIGDVMRLRQILMNLTSNALKFTQEGEVFLECRVRNDECRTTDEDSIQHSELELQFSVKDTGIGIPADKTDRLFKPFSQVDSSTTRKYGGTGLGLAICRKLVQLMRGEIWVESIEGKGSTFFFTIKTSIPATIPGTSLESRNTGAILSLLRNKRVLIVDDNKTNLQILALQCQYWNMLPRTTLSPAEALDWVRNGNLFDLAILDKQLSEMDGAELGAKIRHFHSKEPLPIIILTIPGKPEDNDNISKEIFSGYVSKPIKYYQLLTLIGDIFSNTARFPANDKVKPKLDQKLAGRVPLKILLAEDNMVNQKLVLFILQKMGYNADVAINGLEVLEALKEQHYDIVFMDVQMPGMDGLETTRRIVSAYPRDQRPKIIAMTANAMQGDREKCLEAGMDGYISKPVSIKEIQQILEQKGQIPLTDIKKLRKREIMQDSIINTVRLLEIKDVDENLLPRLIDLFLERSPQLIRDLKQFVQTGDMDNIIQAAHNLKGSSLNLGINPLAEVCEKIELKGRGKDLFEMDTLLDQMENLYKKASSELIQIKNE
jgi:PAS domain S-box-containing protein